MARLRFHHLVVETRSQLRADPLARLLGALPAAWLEAPVDVRLETRPAASGELTPRLADAPSYTEGDVTLRAAGGAVEVCGPGARLTADALPLPRLVGLFDPAAVATPEGLAALARGPALLGLAAVLRLRGLHLLSAACLVLPGERTVLIPGGGRRAGAATLASPAGGRAEEEARSALLASLVAVGAERFADGLVLLCRRGGGLALLGLAAATGERLDAPPPGIILLPRLAHGSITRLEPAGPVEAIGALLEASPLASVPSLPGGEGHLPLLGALADGARVFEVLLGTDLVAGDETAGRRLVEGLADA
jgi:hypothetical protein